MSTVTDPSPTIADVRADAITQLFEMFERYANDRQSLIQVAEAYNLPAASAKELRQAIEIKAIHRLMRGIEDLKKIKVSDAA